MANFFSQVGSALGVSNSSAIASGSSAPAGSSNVGFSLSLDGGVLAGGATLLIAGAGNATVAATDDQPHVIIGGNGTDMLTGGNSADLIIGGPGMNVMTGGGGTDIFGHSAGATDFITDFSPSSGEKIALPAGLTMTGSQTVSVSPGTIGLPSGAPEASTQVTFSDGSTVTLLNSQVHPDSSWFI